jgi:hypothetical protein
MAVKSALPSRCLQSTLLSASDFATSSFHTVPSPFTRGAMLISCPIVSRAVRSRSISSMQSGCLAVRSSRFFLEWCYDCAPTCFAHSWPHHFASFVTCWPHHCSTNSTELVGSPSYCPCLIWLHNVQCRFCPIMSLRPRTLSTSVMKQTLNSYHQQTNTHKPRVMRKFSISVNLFTHSLIPTIVVNLEPIFLQPADKQKFSKPQCLLSISPSVYL